MLIEPPKMPCSVVLLCRCVSRTAFPKVNFYMVLGISMQHKEKLWCSWQFILSKIGQLHFTPAEAFKLFEPSLLHDIPFRALQVIENTSIHL